MNEQTNPRHEDTVGGPEPTHALFMRTTALPEQSSNLAWSIDDHTVEPEPFNPEPFDPKHIERQPRRFDWVGWTGPALLAIAAVVAAIWMLNSLLNYMHHADGTHQQTTSPSWREPRWLPLPAPPPARRR